MNDLTQVELLWLENRIENRVRFGRAAEEKNPGSRSTRPVFRSRQHLCFRALDIQRLWDGYIPRRYLAGGRSRPTLFDGTLYQAGR